MELTEKYIRKPFIVHAVEITESNIAELAQTLGELKTEEKGDLHRQYIQLNRKLVPMVDKAYVGWFVTKLGDKYRCFNPKSFHAQFMTVESPIAWTFGKDDVLTQMDRAGWNYHMDQIASRMLDIPEPNETDDADSAPADGIERPGLPSDEDEATPMEEVDVSNVEARPAEDIEQDAPPVDNQPGVVARKRGMDLLNEGLAVD